MWGSVMAFLEGEKLMSRLRRKVKGMYIIPAGKIARGLESSRDMVREASEGGAW